jgi:hypothetical protein
MKKIKNKNVSHAKASFAAPFAALFRGAASQLSAEGAAQLNNFVLQKYILCG